MADIKAVLRPELSAEEWYAKGFSSRPHPQSLLPMQQIDADSAWPSLDDVPRVDAVDNDGRELLSIRQFVEKFERPRRAVLLRGLARGWPATVGTTGAGKCDAGKAGQQAGETARSWTPRRLSARLGSCEMRLGPSTDPEVQDLCYCELREYLNYALGSTLGCCKMDDGGDGGCDHDSSGTHTETPTSATLDDAPLYLGDSLFGEFGALGAPAAALLRDYTVPMLFNEDLLALAASESSEVDCCDPYALAAARPPFRYILIGPARSGGGLHQDPMWTHAWNCLVSGGPKRWLMFPPTATEPPGTDEVMAIDWFERHYSTLRQNPPLGMIEFLQHAGETVFIPAGWWHVVLNVDTAVAITHNYVATSNFDEAFAAGLREEDPQMINRWHRQLRRVRPDLAERADALVGSWREQERRRGCPCHDKD